MTTSTDTTTTTKRRGGFASKLALLITLVLVAALVIFVLQNTVHTTINFLGWNFDLGQGVSLLGAAVVGAVITLTATAALKVRRAVR
ncbi:lipopolysaccharide assembly protein LapA domain-containing protein [Rhodococcus ruber]|uniref:Lipopolysaccharide assembly protein LapA domain-containing protein n=1 Tax=Rhodococcus ruber TaxID=1830 RepID=A0ABT4MKG4_9NOCA|nr:lipopolysaccharide assembly protein LapA domain-containing protein [Rhodococcus ruber]MCZ4521473.1 lipopolysaccharide assembly protein LapA domain-containing protein [Rhodococcus ruber]